jgi:peptide chain release factor 3
VDITIARWIECDDAKKLSEFRNLYEARLAQDRAGNLAYLAPSAINLNLVMERWPDIRFRDTREH